MSDESEKCHCIGCGCDQLAATTDDGGVPVCEECADYMCTDDGDVICSRMGLGRTCHVCDGNIIWGSIRTGPAGTPNYRIGECLCGYMWIEEDKGGWGHYSYHPAKEED